MPSQPVNRRDFVKTGAVAVAGAAASMPSARAAGANGKIRVGFIGVANRGGQLIKATLPNKDVEIVAVCDVHKPTMEKCANSLGGDVAQYSDFRKMLERKDIDAVFIATPDHWHAIQTIQACEAGIDVYVEKPMTVTIKEGRAMVEAARRCNRIVQVGTHRRSSQTYMRLRQLIRDGAIGDVSIAHCYRLSNMWPDGIGKLPPSKPPEGLDWDMWLGPRPYQPYQDNITPYKFRWWYGYSSQMGNWGVHYFDAIRWMLDEEAPVSISAHGSGLGVADDRTIPVTAHVTFEFASGRLLVFGQYEASMYPMMPGEIDLRGTKGIAYGTSKGFEIHPEKSGQFQGDLPRSEEMIVSDAEGNRGMTADHVRDFLDCMRSRKLPRADVEIGHRSTSFCHLANIALETKSRIDWDSVKERVTNDKAANELLHYEYRSPWKLG